MSNVTLTPSPMTDQEQFDRLFSSWPVSAPAYVALVLFVLGGLVCLVLTIRSRVWFMTTVTVTAWLEALGYVFRLVFIEHPNMNVYIMMQCLLIITPVILPLVDYVVVGRLMMLGDPQHLTFRPVWVARLFFASDILTLSIQGAGGAMITSTDPQTQDMGTSIILVGLSLQLGFFTLFTCLTLWMQHSAKFALKERANPKPQIFWCLYSTIALMYIRNIFRVVEFVMGYDGDLATHEEYLYGFDFVPIFLCVVIFCVFHYGFLLPEGSGGRPNSATAKVAPEGAEEKGQLSAKSGDLEMGPAAQLSASTDAGEVTQERAVAPVDGGEGSGRAPVRVSAFEEEETEEGQTQVRAPSYGEDRAFGQPAPQGAWAGASQGWQ